MDALTEFVHYCLFIKDDVTSVVNSSSLIKVFGKRIGSRTLVPKLVCQIKGIDWFKPLLEITEGSHMMY